MPRFKLTSWNIEHFRRVLGEITGTNKQRRRDAIARAIGAIDPDILCVIEGPREAASLQAFVDETLDGGWRVVTRPDGDYAQRGQQWVWFLVRENLAAGAEILDPVVWDSLAGKHWAVHYWGEMTDETHSHYRHPQVLVLALAGRRVEFVGLHLKSKFNRASDWKAGGARREAYIRKAIANRIKMATEAANVRAYIDRRFEQEPAPAIFVMGDLNDGPGKEHFEREYLFFDLLSNIQGDVFSAHKFLNHALFDAPQDLRWTAQFEDCVDPARDPHILLDHILFTQACTGASSPVRVPPGGGFVEHGVHERVNATVPKVAHTSDHRPVSCWIEVAD